MNIMDPYLNHLEYVLSRGRRKYNERTGKSTLSYFGHQMEFDLTRGFPLLAERKLNLFPIVDEMCWFLSGSTNINQLRSKIWDQWALTPDDVERYRKRDALYKNFGNIVSKHLDHNPQVGDLGPVYGQMWRAWPGDHGEKVDQIQYVLDTLKTNPTSRRIIVCGWNPYLLPDESLSAQDNILNGKQALPPCHTMFQFIAEEMSYEERLVIATNRNAGLMLTDSELDRHNIPKYYLSLKLYARSQDLPIGSVFNIAEYSLALEMVASVVNMIPYRYIHSMGDAHIYEDQIAGVKELLSRPRQKSFPKLQFTPRQDLFDYVAEDFSISHYTPYKVISMPVAK